jgi:hypothetical protein
VPVSPASSLTHVRRKPLLQSRSPARVALRPAPSQAEAFGSELDQNTTSEGEGSRGFHRAAAAKQPVRRRLIASSSDSESEHSETGSEPSTEWQDAKTGHTPQTPV